MLNTGLACVVATAAEGPAAATSLQRHPAAALAPSSERMNSVSPRSHRRPRPARQSYGVAARASDRCGRADAGVLMGSAESVMEARVEIGGTA